MPADTPNSGGAAPPVQVGAERFAIVRQPYAHDSAVKHVTAPRFYIDDILEPVGTLHVACGYAPIAAGRVTAIDLEATKTSAGVVTVLTAADIPGKNDVSPKDIGDDPLIAVDKVNFYGQVLFAVVADTRDQARRAVKKARISTAPTMPIIDVDDALVSESKVLPDYVFERGEPSEEMTRSPRQITGEFRIGGQEHFYLEGQVALAIPGEDWRHVRPFLDPAPDRGPARRRPRARPPRQRRHRRNPPHGRRLRRQGKPGLAVGRAAALAAWKTGHPCKLRLDRDDDMIMTGKRHDFRVDYARRRVARRRAALRRRDAVGALRALGGSVARRGRPHDVPRRQFLLLPGVQDRDATDAHEHGFQHRVPRLRRPAGACCSPSA